MIGKGKAVVGKAAALLKDEALGLIDDAREAKAPIKEGVSTFLKKTRPLPRPPVGSAVRSGSPQPKETGSTSGGS